MASDHPEAQPATVVVTFAFTAKELRTCLISYLVRRRAYQLFVAVGFLVVILGAVTASVFATIYGVALILLSVLLIVKPAITSWRKNPALQGPLRFEFSEAGLHFTSSLTDGHVDWGMYRGVVRTHQALFLRQTGNRLVVVLPRRAFSSAEDEARVADLVDRRTQRQKFARRRRR